MQRSPLRVRHTLVRSPALDNAVIVIGITVLAAIINVATGSIVGLPIVTLVTLGASLVNGFRYDSWRPRWPSQQLVERVREGKNPIGVGYATMLVSVCPIAILLNQLGFGGDSNFEPTAAIVFALCCAMGAAFSPRHIAVDSTGIFVEGAASWRHIPWRALVSIEFGDDQRSLVAHTRRDGSHVIAFAGNSILSLPLLRENIERLRPPKSDFDPQHPRFVALDRNGRSQDTWLADVRTLLAGGSLRDVAITVPDLQQLLAHEDTPADRRIAAAAALAGNDPTAPERIRVAISECDDRATRDELERLSAAIPSDTTQRR
jgi:hypothetical protein